MAVLSFWRLRLDVAVVIGCLLLSSFIGFRIHRQLQTFLRSSDHTDVWLPTTLSGPVKYDANEEPEISPETPSLPPLVANTTFFSLPTSERALTPLRDIDRQQYTIRILSWKRAQFLAASIALHSQCPGVKQIQVVWSVLQEEDGGEDNNDGGKDELPPNNRIPQEVLDNPKVVIEKRTTNRLTNRFDILPTTPTATLGILSIDDDLVYGCDALDMGFFLWAQHNGKHMVTYAPRRHALVDKPTQQWRYDWYKNREYSLGLTSTAFLHRDYLYYYKHYLPRPIYQHIQDNMNCEDIAMSLFVSNLTDGQMPLSVDEWGIHGRIQLAAKTGYKGIKKAGKSHKPHRSGCVNWYATELELKDKFNQYAILHRITATNVSEGLLEPTIASNERFIALEEKRKEWVQMKPNKFNLIVWNMQKKLKEYAVSRNLSFEGHGR